MRFCFITQFFPGPERNAQTGGTISNLNMLRCLSRRGEVAVLSFDSNATENDFAEQPFQVTSRPAPAWRGTQLILHWQDFVRSEVARAVAGKPTPDVVIATTSTLGAFDVCPTGTLRIAVVQAYENFGMRCPWVPLRQRINLGKLAAVSRFQDPRLMRTADGVFTNSRFMQSAIASRFGIDARRIHVLTQSANISSAGAQAPPNTVGFVTRGRDKGISVVLELARRSPDLTYLIYGHNGDVPIKVPANIKWQGWASDRSAMFASAALWIVPSIWAEPFGRVSVEAQAADRSVLVANRGGLAETVFDARFKIDDFSPEAWLSRMRDLLALPGEDIRANGAHIRKAFSDAAHDARLYAALDAVTQGQRTNENP